MPGGRVAKQAPRSTLLDDAFGVSISNRFSPGATLGVGGTAVFGGYPEQREKDSTLTRRQRYETFSNFIASIPIVAASLRFYLNLIGKVNWKIEPAEDSSQAEEAAEFVDDVIHDMTTPWHAIVRRAAMFKPYGFSAQEWTAKMREDGNWGLLDIEPRAQITIERWLVDRTGTVHGVTQRSPQDGEEIFIPRAKLVYIVDDAMNDSPEGLGLLRHVVEASRRLLRYEQLEGFGFETDLRGIPVSRVPHNELKKSGRYTDLEIAAIEQPLRNFSQKHIKSSELGMTLDSMTYTNVQTGQPSDVKMFDIELLKAGSMGLAEQHTAIERVKREIANVFGTEHLLLGSDSKGSFALSADKANNLAMIIDATNIELCQAFRNDIAKPLFALNGWDEEMVPYFKTDKVQWRDIEQVTRALKDLATAGSPLTPDQEAIPEVYDLLGLTAPEPMDMEADAMLRTQPQSNEQDEEDPEEGEMETEDAEE